MSGLLWDQTHYKPHQQTTKFVTSRQLDKDKKLCARGRAGAGGTLIFSYTHVRRLGPFFWLKILNFNIFEVSEK